LRPSSIICCAERATRASHGDSDGLAKVDGIGGRVNDLTTRVALAAIVEIAASVTADKTNTLRVLMVSPVKGFTATKRGTTPQSWRFLTSTRYTACSLERVGIMSISSTRCSVNKAFRDRADIALLDFGGERVEVLRTVFRAMTFPRHTHDFYAIGVGLRGVGSIWYRGERHVRRRGDVVVIPPGEVHTGGVGPCSELLSYLAAYVPAPLVERCAAVEGVSTTSLGFHSPVLRDTVVCRALLDLARMIETPQSGAAAAAAQDAFGLAIATLVRRHGGRHSTRSGRDDPALVRTSREIIQSCYADSARTSLDALASATGVTTFHVIRAFTRAMGVTPHHYLLQVRVERARSLLAAGNAPSVVAAMTGFVDQSHLTAQFKRYVGITPGRYQSCLSIARSDRESSAVVGVRGASDRKCTAASCRC
jgi:AraC-like DNA-binding protein/quercetin dioxygenase-like cupin family protein